MSDRWNKPDTERFCYIARRKCGCICFVTSIDNDDAELTQSNAKEIAECIRTGLVVEHVTVAQAKADPGFFPDSCPHTFPACELFPAKKSAARAGGGEHA